MSLKSYIVAVATLLYPLFVLSIPMNSGDGNINQLILIGSVDGKSYFAEGNLTVTWEEALAFCNTSGLHLASITTVTQSTLLKNAVNNVTFTGYYWTGGRDSGIASQFSWEHNDEVLNSTVASPLLVDIPQQTCLSFRPDDKTFYGWLCKHQYKILCELVPDN